MNTDKLDAKESGWSQTEVTYYARKEIHVELVNPNGNKDDNSDDDHESNDVACYEECNRHNVDGVEEEIENTDDRQVEEKERVTKIVITMIMIILRMHHPKGGRMSSCPKTGFFLHIVFSFLLDHSLNLTISYPLLFLIMKRKVRLGIDPNRGRRI